MRTTPVVVGRVVALVLGLTLVVVGVVIIAWSLGLRDLGFTELSRQVSTAWADSVVTEAWWPWALGAAGLVLALLSLWWIVSLIPRPPLRRLRLPGSGHAGELWVDAREASNAVARALSARIGGHEARGAIRRESRGLVLENQVSVAADAELGRVVSGADRTDTLMRNMLGRDDLFYRAVIRVAPMSPREAARVE